MTTSSHQTIRICAISVVLLASTITSAWCQAPDGDEQFEFQHQDIGRISGLSSGTSQVAPQTTIVARQEASFAGEQQALSLQQHQKTHAASAPERSQSVHVQRQSATGAQRRPNRVTLVARREPAPASGPLAAQLPAPPQQYSQLQLQTAAAPEQQAHPTFAPAQESNQQQSLALASGPALSSFRATGGSVSPRHSALIAQVAAERAAAAASLISSHSEPAPAPASSPPAAVQSSFGSHAGLGLASQQQDQQPAFASFASQLSAPQQQQSGAPLLQATQGHHHQHHQQQQLAASSQPKAAVNQLEEPVVAPSFEHVLGHGCPHKGVFSWENKDHCDRYYMCTNGTFTEEACPNGLAYSQQGAVYQHCAYNWNVNCGRKKTAEPIASPGCPWQFGIFPIVQNGRCSIDYYVCEWGVPDTKRCTPEGLFYDDRIKGCQWADQLGCKSEGLLNFKCPSEDEDNPYWPYPRYYHTAQDVIVCVNEQPRLVHCNEDQLVDPGSLACLEVNKKKKKPF